MAGPAPNPEAEKLERMITMAERLIAAFEADINALKAGKPQEMKSLDPEIQRLSALYGREAAGLNPAEARNAPQDVRFRFANVTGRFRDALGLHQRILTRMRNASEGIVKAVAGEVQKKRAPTLTYAPPKSAYKPRQVAMIYNGLA